MSLLTLKQWKAPVLRQLVAVETTSLQKLVLLAHEPQLWDESTRHQHQDQRSAFLNGNHVAYKIRHWSPVCGGETMWHYWETWTQLRWCHAPAILKCSVFDHSQWSRTMLPRFQMQMLITIDTGSPALNVPTQFIVQTKWQIQSCLKRKYIWHEKRKGSR